jgi:hypothetical protein
LTRRWVHAADSGSECSLWNLPASKQATDYQRARAAVKQCVQRAKEWVLRESGACTDDN